MDRTRLLCWQVDYSALRHQGSPLMEWVPRILSLVTSNWSIKHCMREGKQMAQRVTRVVDLNGVKRESL